MENDYILKRKYSVKLEKFVERNMIRAKWKNNTHMKREKKNNICIELKRKCFVWQVVNTLSETVHTPLNIYKYKHSIQFSKIQLWKESLMNLFSVI